jgi:hypothetical protein
MSSTSAAQINMKAVLPWSMGGSPLEFLSQGGTDVEVDRAGSRAVVTNALVRCATSVAG